MVRNGFAGCIVALFVCANTLWAADKQPRIELLGRAKLAKVEPTTLRRQANNLGDSHVSTGIRVKQQVELTYAFNGNVSPEQLSIKIDVSRNERRAIGKISILASSVAEDAGFQVLRSDVVKSLKRVQKFRFVPVGAKWLLVRFTPLDGQEFRVGEIEVHGRPGKPTTHYKFKESPAKSVQVLQQLKRNLRVSVSQAESELFADAEDGKLDKFSFAEASLIASGVTGRRQRRDYLRQLDELEKKFKQLSSSQLPRKERGRALLQWLHSEALKGGYRGKQTRVSTLLDKQTYNCVSSAVVYNILGRRFGLDLRGIEVPTHAFSILYDDRKHYDVETTSRHGFAPARNSAVVKELRRKNGLHYIPDRYRDLRREVNDMGMVALIYYNRGVVHSRRKEYAPALVAYFGALSLDREFASAVKGVLGVLTNWSLHLARQGDYRESLKVVQVGLKLAPKDARLKNNHIALWQEWARKLIDRNRLDEALKVVRSAQTSVPHGPFTDMESWVFTRPAFKAMQRRRFQTALKIARSGLRKLDGKSKVQVAEMQYRIYFRWGDHEFRRQRFSNSAEAYARGLELKQDDRKLTGNLRYVLWKWAQQESKTKDLDQAVKLLERELRRFKEVKRIGRAGEIFAQNEVLASIRAKKFEQALATFERVKHFYDRQSERERTGSYIYDQWARSYWKRDRQWAKAIEVYQRGLRAFPNSRVLQQNLKFCQAKLK